MFTVLALGLGVGVRLFSKVESLPEPAPLIPELILSQNQVETGDTLVIQLRGTKATSVSAVLGQKSVSFFPFGDSLISLVGIDVKAPIGTSTLKTFLTNGEMLSREIAVSPRAFAITKLVLPPALVQKGVSASTFIKDIAQKDKLTLDEIFKIFTPTVLFGESFTEPLPKWIDVGRFGAIRESAAGSIRHLGVDLRAQIGDPVFAVNDGLARFVGPLPNFGQSVVIDHGLGIFSAYLHLSQSRAAPNQQVKKGEIIGLVGSSGEYSFEPHLHFSVKIKEASVDPRRFLDAANRFLK